MDRARARPTPARLFAASVIAAGWIALVGSSGGCEIAVGDTIPIFSCIPGRDTCPQGQVCDSYTNKCVPACATAASCGSGMTCDPGSGTCVAEAGVGDGPAGDADSGTPMEASVADTSSPPPQDSGSPPDTSQPPPDSPAPCNTIGCGCTGPSECASGLCGDTSSLPQNLVTAAGSNFCTQPCCTSSDCPAGSVCFPASTSTSSTGGNYCVLPKWLGITELGTNPGGGTCSTGRDCRSGVCGGTTCADTCCSDQDPTPECASGTSCTFAPFPGSGIETNSGANCQAVTGMGTNGQTCSAPNRCESQICAAPSMSSFNNSCLGLCRSGSDCPNGYTCEYALPTMGSQNVVAVCEPSSGNTPDGAQCSMTQDTCQGFCGSTGTCTEVCFMDSDCTAATGPHCQPEKVNVTGGGSFVVLACGP